ncbi:MAG: GNAT family N-acetyltransferase, partial [Leptolyngbya sp. SIO4C1]|nr:GNAT family N-acetyltransferase [Leptolyngbya sp. SIO4C1]
KRGSTAYQGIVAGAFTFAPFRRKGFGKRLLAFLIGELLTAYPAVKLWVDDDNIGAISLYRSLGFRQIGTCYTGYFAN